MPNEHTDQEPRSHLRSYMVEVMAGLRYEAMNLLVTELLFALSQESYPLDEFIYALSYYADSQSTWKLVAKHLQLAADELAKIQRLEGTHR